MKLVDQEFFHDPEAGIFDDCFRASLATLLGLPITEVPHFLYDGDPDKVFAFKVNRFLATHGLFIMTLPFKGWDFDAWRRENGIGNIYHILSGPSPRFPCLGHSIVGVNGEMYHDPHPDRTGLAGSSDEWTIGLLVRLRSPLGE